MACIGEVCGEPRCCEQSRRSPYLVARKRVRLVTVYCEQDIHYVGTPFAGLCSDQSLRSRYNDLKPTLFVRKLGYYNRHKMRSKMRTGTGYVVVATQNTSRHRSEDMRSGSSTDERGFISRSGSSEIALYVSSLRLPLVLLGLQDNGNIIGLVRTSAADVS